MGRLVRYSEDDVYVVTAAVAAVTRDDISAQFAAMSAMSKTDWRQVEALQGKFATSYLRLRYGSPETRLLQLREEGQTLAVLWVVPAHAIKSQYAFVEPASFAIISCSTRRDARGRGLYPYGIAQIAKSNLSDRYFIWAHKDNLSSLRGIEKAGGKLVGSFVRERWLGGMLSNLKFQPLEEN